MNELIVDVVYVQKKRMVLVVWGEKEGRDGRERKKERKVGGEVGVGELVVGAVAVARVMCDGRLG